MDGIYHRKEPVAPPSTSPDQTVSNPPAATAHRRAGGRAILDVPQTSPREPFRCWGVGGGSPPRRRGIPKGRAIGPSAAGGSCGGRLTP